jgi:predicted O-linked N-acetylglucosamine transferase (SPINDLY family)
MTDASYTVTQQTCTQIQSALENAMNDRELEAAMQLCDALGGQLPDDTETLGHAGDLVTAINDAKAAMARAIEAAQAVKDSHEKNHGAANEAAQATGHMAEREHHMAE